LFFKERDAMFLSVKIIRNLFVSWIAVTIVIFAIVFTNASPGPGQPPLAFFRSIFLMISIISLLIIFAGYPVMYLLERHPAHMVTGISVLFLADIAAAVIGNAICYYLSDYLFIEGFYRSGSDHLIDILIFLVPVFAVSMVIIHLRIKKSEIETELNSVKNKIKSNVMSDSISIKLNEGYCVINFDSLVYISSHGKRTTFHTIEKDYTAIHLLKDIKGKLPEDRFIRIHRQYIINTKFLREVRYYEGGRYMVYLSDADESILPVGRNITPLLKERIGI
jgi:hypothetical protein